MPIKILITYFLTVNILSVLVCVYDKNSAKRGKWRVPEKTLFLLSFLGGAPFMFATMRIIHHKTRHKRFMLGLPLIIILQLAIFFYIINLTI